MFLEMQRPEELEGTEFISHKHDTIEIAKIRAQQIAQHLVEEVQWLLDSGHIDPEHHNRAMLLGVALDYLADKLLASMRGGYTFRRIKSLLKERDENKKAGDNK